jgi:hypothetical protein
MLNLCTILKPSVATINAELNTGALLYAAQFNGGVAGDVVAHNACVVGQLQHGCGSCFVQGEADGADIGNVARFVYLTKLHLHSTGVGRNLCGQCQQVATPSGAAVCAVLPIRAVF